MKKILIIIVITIVFVLFLGTLYYSQSSDQKELHSTNDTNRIKILNEKDEEIKIEALKTKINSVNKDEKGSNENGKTANSLDDFARFLDKVYRDLPTQEDVKNLSDEEVHDTPKIVLKTADALGDVAEYLSNHPEAKEITLDFYRKCASTSQILNSIKQLCQYHVDNLNRN